MILLTATRIDVYGAFIFKIEVAGSVRLITGDPELTAAKARGSWPFRPAFMERLCDGLTAAGVPLG